MSQEDGLSGGGGHTDTPSLGTNLAVIRPGITSDLQYEIMQ